jgi:hypothetical protein
MSVRVYVYIYIFIYLFIYLYLFIYKSLAPTRRIFVKFDTGDSKKKFVEKFQIWLKSDIIGHFTCRTKEVYVPDDSMKYFAGRQEYKDSPFLFLHGNTQRIYIVHSYIWVNNNTKGMKCCFSIATVVTQTRPQLLHCTYSLSLSCSWLTQHNFILAPS